MLQKKKQIAGWVASADGASSNPDRHSDSGASDDDDDLLGSNGGRARNSSADGNVVSPIDSALLVSDWDAFLTTHLAPRIFARSPRSRIAFCQRAARDPQFFVRLLFNSGSPSASDVESRIADVQALLRTSMARIEDRNSRASIITLARALIFASSQDQGASAPASQKRVLTSIQALLAEAQRLCGASTAANVGAISTRAALLDWLSLHLTFLIQAVSTEEVFKASREQVFDIEWAKKDPITQSKALVPLLNAIAFVLDSLRSETASPSAATVASSGIGAAPVLTAEVQPSAAAANAVVSFNAADPSSSVSKVKNKRKHVAIVRGALVVLRRQVRLSFRHLPALFATVLPTSGSGIATSSRHATFVGLLLSVALRLRAFSEPNKGLPGGLGRTLVERHRAAALNFYAEHVIAAASSLKGSTISLHIREAYSDYFAASPRDSTLSEAPSTQGLIIASDISGILLPAFAKCISKTPEAGLPVLLSFLNALPSRPSLIAEGRAPRDSPWEAQLWATVLPAAKSSSILTRQAAIEVAEALVSRLVDRSGISETTADVDQNAQKAVEQFATDILDGPLKATPVTAAATGAKGKAAPKATSSSSGAASQPLATGEVRASMYALLAAIPPQTVGGLSGLSPLISKSLVPCLVKDVAAAAPAGNWLAGPESLIRSCLDALIPHLRAALQSSATAPGTPGALTEGEAKAIGEAVAAALSIAPGANPAKQNAKRALWARVGDVFVAALSTNGKSSSSVIVPQSPALDALAAALLPALEAALKTTHATPLSANPVEGFVSIAIALSLGQGGNKASAISKLWTGTDLLKGKMTDGLLSTGGKTGFFLLNDKIWRKSATVGSAAGATTSSTSSSTAAPANVKDAANTAATTRAAALVQEEQDLWLLRALGGLLRSPDAVRELSTKVQGQSAPANPDARSAFGAALLHLTLDSTSMLVRQTSSNVIRSWMTGSADVLQPTLASALRSWVRNREIEAEKERERFSKAAGGKSAIVAEDDPAASAKTKAPRSYSRDLRALLSVIVSIPSQPESHSSPQPATAEVGSDLDPAITAGDTVIPSAANPEKVLSQDLVLLDLLIVSHVSELGPASETGAVFVDLCQSSGVDPHELIVRRKDEALGEVRSYLSTAQEDTAAPVASAGGAGLYTAATRALSTLAFVAPHEIVPTVVKQITTELVQISVLTALTADDIGMWKMPEGTMYNDVLDKKQDQGATASKGGKEKAMEAWEAEVRANIAKKKAAAGTGKPQALTPAQKKEVDAQLKLETQVRLRVEALRENLVEALQSAIALINARSDVLDGHLPELVDFVLRVLQVPQAKDLAGPELQATFGRLLSCASARLSDYKTVAGMALLRIIDESLVPQDFLAEPLKETVLRVLYRIRFLSEQSPLDLATIAFLGPLIHRIIETGGLGVGPEEQDDVFEQMQLSLDFLIFHCEVCDDPRMPRSQFIDDFVQITAKHTQLSKEAVSGLRSLGEAMRSNATIEEQQKLFGHLLSDAVYVRTGCLQALQPLDLTDHDFCAELWVACFDGDDENVRLAEKAWEENGMDVPPSFPEVLVPFLPHANAYVRRSSGKAIAAAAEMHPDQIPELLTQLFALYHEKAKVLKPEYDQFGMVIDGTANQQDPWRARVAVALTIKNLAPHLNPLTDVPAVFDFLVSGQAVGDRSDRVRQRMLDAGSTIIDLHGAECLSRLMAMFESFFNNANSSGDSNDGVLEAVVILFGRLARHLAPTDKRVKSVIDKLLDALKTPSELVQSAVSECLSPLVGSVRDDTPKLVEKLFDDLLHAPKYAERRGAAYGLAGLIKGRGIGSIAEFNVMSKLAEAAEDKKNTNARQGAMFAYETLTASLQRIFEPYIQQILPHLLGCFSDSAKDVQEATQDAAKVIMKTVSGHCVKLILPSLLAGLDEKQWRTKKGAIELLGAMAYCAPRQLSISLPTVIPQLSGVLTDSHTQVRNAANQSLKQFGSVISNPEIKKLVSTLLQALIEPNSKTAPALAAVLSTSFVHYIDSSSLALLVPIIDRGLRERSAQVQKDAARIVGNMAGLTDSKDFVPYLPRLVPLVRIVLVSPVPEARAVAAKALGTLVERLGEGHFIDLIPSLLQVLRSDATSVDRQGSAQGLAEVLAGLGIERMEALLPDIINGASSSRSYVREGYISLLIYLPATFGHRFSPHLGRIIPPILGGIADDSETVRDASMRAGRMIIANYSVKAVDLLLPELEKGLFDGSWRIRMSSIQLAADLLFRLSGISGKNEAEEDAEDGDGEADGEELAPLANNSVQKALIEALGQERRDRILAALFIVRQDPNIPVRQAAIHTWKALVSNTHRTAREILPVMLDMLISSLSAKGADQREIASRTIAELVRKIGEKILRETIPLLRVRGATSTDSAIRAGVCMAVTEILDNATKTQLEDHEDALIAIIRHSLVDEAAEVRSAAAQAFDAAQEQIGPRAIDETIPTLLDALKDPNSAGAGTALAALREVMRARADVVFPVLLPTLTAQPLTAFNANALAALVQVAGPALPRKLSTILTALAKSLEDDQQSAVRPDVDEALATILSSVSDGDTLHQLMIILLGWAGNAGAAQRCITGCNMFAIFCSHKKGSVSISDYMVDWIRKLVALFEAQDDALVGAAWSALEASLKIVSKEEMEQLVVPLRRAVENVGEPGQGLPGFCRPKGVGPLVPVFLAGLMNGTAEQREQGAMGLSDIVERTSAEAIKPFVTTIVGPLIRACGDRHTPPVKTAIITALTTTLRHVAQHCRPFYPQLQRSFQKAVADPISINVRSRAGVALGVLMEHQPRADPVIAELLVGASAQLDSQADPGAGATAASGATASTIDPADLADASVLSLAQVLLHAPPKNIGAASREGVVKLLDNAFQHAADVRESYRKAVGEVCGAMAHMDASTLTSVVNERVLNPGNDIEAQLASLCVVSMLTHAPAQLYGETDADVPSKLLSKLNEWSTLAHGVVRQVREAKALLKTKEPWASDDKLLATLTA